MRIIVELTTRTTFSLRLCSDSDMFILPAKFLMDLLKCADPVKYISAQAYSS